MWFLAGSFGSVHITRQCTVSPGRALFFPLINQGSFAFLNDPPAQRTEDFLRSQVTYVADAVFSRVEIDGVAVVNPAQYLEKSVIFDVFLPLDNVFGCTEAEVPQLTLSPSVDEGFYLFVFPVAGFISMPSLWSGHHLPPYGAVGIRRELWREAYARE